MTHSCSIELHRPIRLDWLQPLIESSLDEGFDFLERLAREYRDGSNTFEKPGEAFFVARSQGQLVGVAGLNLDPFERDPNIGRLRRVYVVPPLRGQGIGRRLVEQVIQHSQFPVLHLRSNPLAAPLYESLGFVPVALEHATHRRTR